MAAFTRLPASRRFDNDLLQVLAADTASEGTSCDLFIHDDRPGGADSDESCEGVVSSNPRSSSLHQFPLHWLSSAAADHNLLADTMIP